MPVILQRSALARICFFVSSFLFSDDGQTPEWNRSAYLTAWDRRELKQKDIENRPGFFFNQEEKKGEG